MAIPILSDYKILDLSSVVLGPFCTQMLGDMGADVIKVENPAGDIMRHAGPMRSFGMGPIYLTINRNKRAMTLDLRTQGAKEILRRLIKEADVLIHNVRAAGMKRLGFDYESVKALNKEIVYVHAVGFGSKGHYEGRQAYDDLIQSGSGITTMLPRQDGSEDPRYIPGLIADKTTGLFATNAVLAGLLHRERTGEGQFIEVPMLECLVAFNMAENLYGHTFVPPDGPTAYTRSLSPNRKPYKTKDGYVAIMPYSDDNWDAFFTIAGCPQFVGDPRFVNYAERTKNIEVLYALIAEYAPTKTSREWVTLLGEANVPAMWVHTLESVLDDPQFTETNFVQEREHPTEGAYKSIAHPIQYGSGAFEVRIDPPKLGEHNLEVVTELGFEESEFELMKQSGVFG